MNKIGIRAHDLGQYQDAKTLAHEVEQIGFDGVQLVFKKAISSSVDFSSLEDVKEAFNKTPKIMMLGAYFNPIHPDLAVVETGIKNFKNHLTIAQKLNCLYVGSETGSLMGSPWGYVPENHNQANLDKVIEIFKDLTIYAADQNAYVALEGAWAHVAHTPARVKEIVEKVNHPHLKVTVDLYNFLNIDNYHNQLSIFDEAIRLLKDEIVIFHLKDFIVENQKLKQVGLGQGLMKYPTIIDQIIKNCPNAYLIFEGVVGDDITSSLTYIKNILGGKNNEIRCKI